MTAGLIVFAHGSSVESANEAVRTLAAQVARAGAWDLVEAAFLEGGRPDLPEAVDRLAARNARRIVVVPYFLTLGLHLQRDLPRIIEDIRKSRSDLKIQVTAPLDGHPALTQIVLARAREALE